MRLWRLTAFPDLSGEGGLFIDGRWHRRGHRVIYASEHPALAILEVLANSHEKAEKAPVTLRLMRIDVDDDAQPDHFTLPKDWSSKKGWTQGQGTGWLEACDSLLVRVPSVLVPHACNLVINPVHPSMKKMVTIGSVEAFRFDRRLR